MHDAVVEHLQREAEIGGYEAARERKDRWEHTYDALAGLLNAGRDEIAVIGVHYYNDDSGLDRLVEGVKEITWSRN